MDNNLQLNKILQSNITEFKSNPSSIDVFVNDIFNLLSINEKNLNKVENQNFLQRSWNTILKKNKKLIQINEKNLQNVQKLNINLLMELEKQNMLTRENQVKIYNKVNELHYNHIELKEFIDVALNKIISRFERLESKVDFHTLLLEIQQHMYSNMPKEEALVYILGLITDEQWKDERCINLLKSTLINEKIINDNKIALKYFLFSLSKLDSNKAGEIYSRYITLANGFLGNCIIRTLEFAALAPIEKKYRRFEAIIDELALSYAVSEEISYFDIYELLIGGFKDKALYLPLEQDKAEKYEYLPVEGLTEEESKNSNNNNKNNNKADKNNANNESNFKLNPFTLGKFK